MTTQRPRQPLLNDATVILCAPTQVWSRPSGDTEMPIDGIFHGDVRHISTIGLTCRESEIEWIYSATTDSNKLETIGLLRDADSDEADPKLLLRRTRTISAGKVSEVFTVESHLPHRVNLHLRLLLKPTFTPLSEIKDGRLKEQGVLLKDNEAIAATCGSATCEIIPSAGSDHSLEGNNIILEWEIQVAPMSSTSVNWTGQLSDSSLVIDKANNPLAALSTNTKGDLKLWQQQAWSDLNALQMSLPGSKDQFFAAGAPWFFTLFGRDSLWTARLLLEQCPEMALSTLRALAHLQGTEHNPETAEEPGKILHELRSASLEIPGENIVLPPIYFGSVDATLLWICLLGDIWHRGDLRKEVQDLLPILRGALHWMLYEADGDEDGFLDYIDQSGKGLSNQGWKDSGDSIQWRNGQLAEGPIALCEVQGYAYEAAMSAANIIEAFPAPTEECLGSDISSKQLREWAEELKINFSNNYWVSTAEGKYPAIALDGEKQKVDTLSSNIGHLLGTGILSEQEEHEIVKLLIGPSMFSGFGIRTLSNASNGYWPLSYHGGSVWAHDTGIIIWGMLRSGFASEAYLVGTGLVRAAKSFNFRIPELYSGDSSDSVSAPSPYPAACRPQAWAAAASFVIK